MTPDSPLRILGSRVDSVDMNQAEHRIAQMLDEHRFAHVVTFGSEMAMLAIREPAYRDAINAADLIVPDTIGVVYAARMLGYAMPERVAGIELVERACALCARKGYAVFLLGGAQSIAEKAGVELQRRYPGLLVAGAQHGYFSANEEPGLLDRIRTTGARLVLVALGFPKQEYWIRKHAGELGPVVCIGAGGSLDVIAGKSKRAPQAMRRLGLEWLYRLVTQPRRLGRQLVLPQFAIRVAGQAILERTKNTRGPNAD